MPRWLNPLGDRGFCVGKLKSVGTDSEASPRDSDIKRYAVTISGPVHHRALRGGVYRNPSLVHDTRRLAGNPCPSLLRTSRGSSHSHMAEVRSPEPTKGHSSPGLAQGSQPDALSWLVRDGPEYEQRKKRPQFVPPSVSIKDVHAAVPRHLFERSTAKGLFYVGRTVALSVLFYKFATRIDHFSWATAAAFGLGPAGRSLVSWTFWILYWFWQSVALAGFWTLGIVHI